MATTAMDLETLATDDPQTALDRAVEMYEAAQSSGDMTYHQTSKGEMVQSPFTDFQAAQVIIADGDGRKPRSNFKRSMVQLGLRSNGMSDKQRAWLHYFAEQAVLDQAKTDTANGDFRGIIEMMDEAAENKQYPKLYLGNYNLKMHRTKSGKEPGSVVLVSNDSYHDSDYYGRVSRNGTANLNGKLNNQPSHRGDHPSRMDELMFVLHQLNDQPEVFAASQGQENGECMFCGRNLTDDRSIQVGYGPVCAGNHGLDWG